MAAITTSFEGHQYVITTYEEPCPGHASTDRVQLDVACIRCCGSGNQVWWTASGEHEGICLGCEGLGTVTIERPVSAIRRDERIAAVMREYAEEVRYWRDQRAAERPVESIHDTERRAVDEQIRNMPAGTNGERLRNIAATVTVVSEYEREAYSGGTEIARFVVFRLASGQELIASGTAAGLFGLRRGDTVALSGTVKGTAHRGGKIQTRVQRVAVRRINAA